MDSAFWLQRWQDNQIGFHQARVLPLLQQHWPVLQLPAGSRVCVPLAGKSLDMLWLAAQGHRVLGVELSPLAVQQFFADNGLSPEIHESPYGRHYVAGAIELICGDIFALDAAALADCAGVYDRAALIALPKAMRRRYVETFYACLPTLCQGLLITLEYPQAQREGPPFSVEQREVERLFGPCCTPQLLERRDILQREPGFVAAGVDALTTAVYHLPARAG